MSEFRTKLLVGMLVLLAGVPEASPQTEQPGSLPTQLVVRQTRKAVRSSGSLATGKMPAAGPSLCFQPGVGWQSIIPETPSAPARLEGVSPTSAALTQTTDARSSGAKPAKAAQCAALPVNKGSLAADREELNLLHLSGTMRSAGPRKPGDVASRHAHSPLTRPGYLASAAESDARPDQVGALPFRAYISPIKLRRLIRNAPDLQTRINRQQLQNDAGSQVRKEKAGKKTSAIGGKPLRGERAERTSSRGMAISDRPQGHFHGLGESR